MKKVTLLSPLLKICLFSLFSLFITACDSPTAPDINTNEIKEAHPPLDLSIDNMAIESLQDSDATFLSDKAVTDENSELFETLSKGQAESNINISGKLLANEEKLKNGNYFESVEGVQINIESRFK